MGCLFHSVALWNSVGRTEARESLGTTQYCGIVEAPCYVVTAGEEMLMSIYVAESIKQWQ